jgi:hypothetical protein
MDRCVASLENETNMKISLKRKLIFSLTSGLTFAILNSLTSHFFLDEYFSLAIFVFNLIFFGLFFGFGYFFLSHKLDIRSKERNPIKLSEDETIELEGSAKLFRETEWVRGRLVITNKRLIFKSHKLNIQSGEIQLALDNIKETESRHKAIVFKNGMSITDNIGQKFNFLVMEQNSWITKINTTQQGLKHNAGLSV